jgi:hypothetical protein
MDKTYYTVVEAIDDFFYAIRQYNVLTMKQKEELYEVKKAALGTPFVMSYSQSQGHKYYRLVKEA